MTLSPGNIPTGPNLINIYIINGERYNADQLSDEQKRHIETTADNRAYDVFRLNLIETYGDGIEAFIYINTDRQPHEYKVFDKNNQPLSKELNRA